MQGRRPHSRQLRLRPAVVPPLVRSHLADAEGLAYLIARIRIPDGTWGAQIAWVSVASGRGDWVLRSQTVMASVVTRIEGQDYSGVPLRDARG
jgi:hypothetical protein